MMASTSSSSNIDNNNIDNTLSPRRRRLFLFDFDGVVCDSCDECTVSALRTCHRLNVIAVSAAKKTDSAAADTDDNYNTDNDSTDNNNNNNTDNNKAIAAVIMEEAEYPPPWLFAKMREIRPAIEVGWQIPVLLAVLLEQQQQQQEQQQQQDQHTILSDDEIVANYQTIIDKWLQKWNLTKRDMVDTFGSVRDAWIAEDMTSWLAINKFYPGVPQALDHCHRGSSSNKSILVTTKQQRFAIALCRHAGVCQEALPDNCIYGLGMYNGKSDVIAEQMQNGGYAPTDTHFFEDRWPTLVKCLQDERLHGVRFYLCSWGYVTQAELELANAEPRVEVIGLDDFARIVTATP